MYARALAFLMLVLAFGGGPSAAWAQDSSVPPSTTPPDTGRTAPPVSAPPTLPLQALSPNTLSVWAGGSVTAGGPIGNIEQAQFALIGFRYERLLVPPPPVHHAEGPALAYTVDFFPVLVFSIPPKTIALPPLDQVSAVREHGLRTYGIGLSPAGLRLTFWTGERLQPFLGGSTGFAYFAQSIPNEQGRHVNFMFDLGAGVQFVLAPNVILTAGYRYHHLSNGFRGQINPGVDANLLHIGVSVPQ